VTAERKFENGKGATVNSFRTSLIAAAILSVIQSPAMALTFENDVISGSFDSTITFGAGRRLGQPHGSLIAAGNQGGPAGQADPWLSVGDQGNLNYAKGDFFTQYLKGNHELLLKLPSDVKVMARVNWLRDWGATRTTGFLSANSLSPLQDGFADDARRDARFKARLLDFWVSKTVDVGEQQMRFRVGNQVISWGESLFQPGGINSTNALDIQRLSQPGTQLKEAVLPAPMVSVATGLGSGLNMEAYVQSRWNASYFPPTGSYWSTVNGLGKGYAAYGYSVNKPSDSGQWGVSLRWQPESVQANFGLYAMNYHDKTPNISLSSGAPTWVYAENRKLFGVSANAPLGDWALGTELSYRPRDAVALNGLAPGGCGGGGNCWVDQARYQWHGTALFSATPSNAKGLLDVLGADTATLLFEAVVIRYPGLKQTYNNGTDYAAAGGWFWTGQPGVGGDPRPEGSKTSAAINFDFSWVYDGTLVPGWQVTPGIYYFHAIKGRTPNASAQFMKGAKSLNLYVNFTQNPANWQFGFNVARFWGGTSAYDQPLRDRDFIGMYLSRNF
jgi:hypothetical protein